MIEAIDPKTPVEYIAKGDTDDPTVWLLRNLTIKQETFLRRHALGLVKSTKNNEEKTIESMAFCLNLCLLGANNFKTKTGGKVKFVRDEEATEVYQDVKPWTDETLQQLPYEIREELYIYIISGYRQIKEEDAKN